MMVGLILAASVSVQLMTAYLAIKLIRVTGNRIAWGLISLAIFFMAVRRGISLYEFISSNYRHSLELSFELIGLVTSILMFSGVVLISPLFKSMANEIARRKEAEAALREMAMNDELTGLYNRRGFFGLIEQYVSLAKRQGKKIFVLYADVDNFKSINDDFGHNEGDIALRESAVILKETFRESDVIARVGGDEFAVVSLEASESDAQRVIARLQENLEIFNSKRKSNYNLSISWGISCWDPKGLCSIDDALFKADKAMYEQKKNKVKL